MNRFLVALGWLLVASTSLATPQDEDPVTWKGETYYPLTGPDMMWNASPNTPRRLFDINSTSNYKGYHATWEIKDDVLYLDSFKAREHGKKVSLRQIFPGRKPPIEAEWFSNAIAFSLGKVIGIDTDFRPVYDKELWLYFKRGKHVGTEVKTNNARRIRR